jgi:hypothetical protein
MTGEVEVYGYCTDITHKRDAENYLKLTVANTGTGQ